VRGEDARLVVSVGLAAAGVSVTAEAVVGPWVALLAVAALGVLTWAYLHR
jgi:hypothetical protein